MREFIYLSDRKLKQFLPDPIPKWRRLGRLQAQVNAPIGSLSLEQLGSDDQSDKATHFQNVLSQIEENAQWFTADNIQAGEWIFFEDRLNYWVLQPLRGPEVVLFSNLSYGEGRDTRLLLHGSPEHLLGAVHTQDQLRLGSVAGPTPSEGFWFRDMLPALRKMIRTLDDSSGRHELRQTRNLAWDVEDILLALDKSNNPSTAMWLGGYGRVTAKLESSSSYSAPKSAFVTASPLYVEVLMPPGDEN